MDHRLLPPRFLVLFLAAVCAAACARPLRTDPPPQRAGPLRFGADVHLHLTLDDALPFYSGEPGSKYLAQQPYALAVNQIDPTSLADFGVRLALGVVWAPPALRPGRDDLDEMVDHLRKLEAFTRRRSQFALAHDAAMARHEISRGKIAVIPAIEGVDGICDPSEVDFLYAEGARVLAPVHFFDNSIAGAEEDQFGAIPGAVLDGPDVGLTALGRAVVGRMIQLGIAVDVAHASEKTISDVLDLTSAAGVPILYSHVGGAVGSPRTLSDALAKRIADAGGLLGVGIYWSSFLQEMPVEDRFAGFVPGTCDEAVAHWTHFSRLLGPEHVVLGSDFGSLIDRARPGGGCPNGIRNTRDLPELFGTLLEQGVPRASLDDSGERVLRWLERVQAKADPTEQQKARQRRYTPRRHFEVPL